MFESMRSFVVVYVASSVVLGRYPEGLRLSLIVYGDTTGACDDVRIVRPLSTLDVAGKSWLGSEVHQLVAQGKTPIALALRRAGQELAKFDSVSSVALISDGKETCGGDPAGEAGSFGTTCKAGPGHNFDPVQTSDRNGTDLLVPAGRYDLWILGSDGNRELLEEDLEVMAGQRLQLD